MAPDSTEKKPKAAIFPSDKGTSDDPSISDEKVKEFLNEALRLIEEAEGKANSAKRFFFLPGGFSEKKFREARDCLSEADEIIETLHLLVRVGNKTNLHPSQELEISIGERPSPDQKTLCENIRARLVTNLYKADLGGADLRGVDLSNANLIRANLGKADLSKANLRWANLIRANLTDANLTSANLSRTLLMMAFLTRANLSKTDLNGALLNGADLTEASLSGADLSGVNLSGAHLGGADLSGADLFMAKVSNEQLAEVKTLDNATMPDGEQYDPAIHAFVKASTNDND